MELVTGRAGSPHITSQQDRQKHQGIWGDGAYILATGNQLEPQVQSSNKILIKDGALMFQGALFSVKVGTTDEITINNGNQGMQRKDLVVVRYTYDSAEQKESAEWVVIQGEPAASNPVAPSGTSGDIQAGDATVDCPFMIVNLDGINVTGVDIIPDVAPDIPTLNASLSELIGNFKTTEYTSDDLHIQSFWNVADLVCQRQGKRAHLHMSLSTSAQFDANTMYTLNSLPIPKELRPPWTRTISAISCGNNWENARACVVNIHADGYIKICSPVKQAFYKISGDWDLP